MSEADGPETAPQHHFPAVQVRADPMLLIVSAAVLYVLRETASVCVPVLISILLAYALEPLVAVLVRWRMPRPAAAILIYALLGIGVALVARGVRDDAAGFLRSLPRTVDEIRDAVVDAGRGASQNTGVLDRLRRASAAEQHAAPAAPAPAGVRRVTVQQRPFDMRAYLRRGASAAIDAGIGTLVVIVLTFLLLVAGDLFKRKIVRLAGPHFERRKITVEVIHAVDLQIERYLVVRLLISVLVAVGTGVGVWLIGLDNAVVWGVVAGVLNVLPFAGPAVAIALIAIAAFLQFRSVETTVAAAVVASVVAFIEGNFLTPWLTSRACELNTVAVFVSLLFWGWVWGIWGLVLAIPIMVAIKAAADQIEPLHAIAELLGQ